METERNADQTETEPPLSLEAASQPTQRGSESASGSIDTAGTGSHTETTEEVGTDWPVRFTLLRLSAYHQYRRSYLDRSHRWLLFIVVIAGTSAFAGVQELAMVAVIAGLADMVFNLSDRARDHEFLYRRAVRLLGQVTADPDPMNRSDWETEIHAIYADAPPNHFRALDAWCHNLVVRQIGSDEFVRLRWFHRLLKNVLTFTGSDFPPKQP